MQAFEYTAPQSLAQALEVLKQHKARGARAQILAGGTDLLVQIRSSDRTARTIVDIKKLPDTNRLEIGDAGIYIGAAVPAARLTRHAALKRLLPGLVEATGLIGSTQIQGRASIGGNLCNASPAGDTIPALIANGGRCVIATPAGLRELPVAEFVTGVQRNALADDEFLVGIRFDRPAPGSADAYLRFIPRTEMDIAVAGAAVSITLAGDGRCTAARVAIGAVAPTALLVEAAGAALVGSRLENPAVDAMKQACRAAASPISDKRGTAEYRRKVVGVLAARAARCAFERAGGPSTS